MKSRLISFCACIFLLALSLSCNASAAEGQISPSRFLRIAQSSNASATNIATNALDGVVGTTSLTADVAGGFWTVELGRPFTLTRLEIVNRAAPNDAAMDGLTLRLSNMDDQIVFQTNLTSPGPGATLFINVPAGVAARTVWIGLPGAQVNGAGNYQVGLAEVRVFGVLHLPFGPEPAGSTVATNSVRVWQSSEYGGFPASFAINGDLSDFTHTDTLPNSYWMADVGRAVPVTRVDIVNRSSCCAERLGGLVARLYDGASNSVWSATVVNPGLGGTVTLNPPANTTGRWLRVGLENNQQNSGANYYVSLAEVRLFSGTTNVLAVGAAPGAVTNNLASFKPSYMVRLTTNIPPAFNANDDNFSTETKTTTATVDGYWETDLGATYALYGVRSIAASGIGSKLTNCTVHLYNDAHESVFAERITGVPDTFDSDLKGPVFARYVRVGLEDKKRTHPTGDIEFYIGFREVEVFGRPTNEVGILSFTASTNEVAAGGSVTLSWDVEDVRRVELHPGPGSVGANTALNGAGSLSLTVSNTTEFTLVASNAAGIFSRSVTVTVAPNPPAMRLSEFVAENRFSLEDGNGDASDWIELRNTSNEAVNLAGYGLSDDPAQPMKWLFPATNVPPHGTLIVFASGRNTPLDPAGKLHASFRLNKAGGSVVLTSPTTDVVDSIVAYPEQDTDLAYGRDLEGNWTFLEPTPGAVNYAPTYLGWLRPLDFSHARGFHETPFTLTLTNNSAGSSIVYSLDGSEPTLSYTNALAISTTKAVRALAVRAGYKSARSQTKTFIFINDVIASPLMNTNVTRNPLYEARLRPALRSLPTISVCVPGQPEYAEKEGSVEILWPDGGEDLQANCEVSRFGNAWTQFAKRSFRLKFRARYGTPRLNVPLLDGFDRGVLAQTSFDKLDLRSGSQDMVERGFYMAGRFVEDSMLDMGSLNPHGRFVHVYVNGVYWGQYDARETMDENFLADYLGGAQEDYVVVKGNDNVGDDFALGAPEAPVIAPWERVFGLRSSYADVRPYLDVPHLIDFMLLWNYGNCESEYRSVGSVNAGSGFKFWIADADGFLRTSAIGLNRTVRNGPGYLFSALLAENNSDFKALLADRIYKHFLNNGALTPAALDARLSARMQEINDSLVIECARWNYRTPASWVADANSIRTGLFPGRTAQLLGMLRAAGWYPTLEPPVFNQYGGTVTNGFQPQLTAPAGIIYYTLDGTDPRLPGGGISPSALIWVPDALTITEDLLLTVRVLNGAQWSALAQPLFLPSSRRLPASRDLLITEIHYNPADNEEFEFIELFNASTRPLDLSGVTLESAVRYAFPKNYTLPPGGFTLIVENAAQFTSRYRTPTSPYFQPGLRVAGEWAGALNNAGETVLLLASNGTVLASVDYKSGGDWPSRANGTGSSLELRALPAGGSSDADVRAFVADGLNWSSSSLYHGSPGRLDAFAKSVRINEVLSHSRLGEDWIELFNPGTQAVSLVNVTLTDNLAFPNRYTFPGDTVLAPGQFLVLNATQLGYGFGEFDDNAALLEMNGTNILRFLDTVDFPGAPAEEPFGVYQRMDGGVDFTELAGVTPGAINAAPRIGPVVISEIHSAPAGGLAEFIELTSITNVPVPLHDPSFPTNVWKLDGVGTFSFPTGVVIAPFGTIVVCSTNPSAFRAQYGVSEAVPVFGPWSGALDASGETLRLLRPGTPQTNGLPLYRVDHVSYRNRAPWPTFTTGVSLQKSTFNAYGNDSFHWTAALPTPGANLPPGQLPIILAPPQNVTVNEGESASFQVSATGTPPVLYQWRFRGAPLTGATNTTLTLANVTLDHAGAYDVAVFGPSGSTVSAPATLFVIKQPVINLPPLNQAVRPSSNATFRVVATGNGTLRYLWRFNGVAIPDATNNTFTITAAGLEHRGIYTVQVSDEIGSIITVPVTLKLLIDPLFVQHPLGQTVLLGGTATLSVVVTNTATLPISYRWRRGGATYASFFVDSHTNFLVITNVQVTGTNWTVVVTNAATRNAGILSSTAALTILTDTNGNSLPDSWETTYGFGPGNPALRDADVDGDGATNLEESLAGTDPTDAASVLRVTIPLITGGVEISFGAISNRTYSVLYRDTPAGGPWNKLADVPARAINRVETILDRDWTTNRFYRAVVPWQP